MLIIICANNLSVKHLYLVSKQIYERKDFLFLIKMLKHYISPNDLSDAGIILITSNDPISRIIIAITKQEFSSIGFYYKTSATGAVQVRVITVDIFGVRSPEWLKPSDTIHDLVNNPLISQIAIKRLKPVLNEDGSVNAEKTKQLQVNYRTAIAQVMGMKGELSMRDSISQLFGYSIKSPQCTQNAVEMVNKVIQLIGRWNDVPANDTISLESFSLISPPNNSQDDYKSKVQLMGYLSSLMNTSPVENSQTKQIQSYIVDNNLLDSILYLTLPPHNAIREEVAIAESIVYYRPYLSRAVSTFIDMLLMDQEFFRIVIMGINRGKVREELDFQVLKNFISDLHNSHEAVLNTLLQSIHKGHLNKQEIEHILKNHYSNHQLLKILNRDEQEITTSNAPSEDRVLVYGQSTEKYHKALTEIHRQLQDSLSSMETGQMLYFDLNQMIDNVNSLTKMSNSNLSQLSVPKNETSYSAIVGVSRNHDEEIPIKLQCGEKIMLPLINPNLSSFDRSVLLEMLETLDALPYNDHKYDHLRTKIAYELAK